ncbi:hypothetical protein, partial [Faecalicoccus pleomorphus]
PNSEVKHFSGDNSWACPCQDSTLPGLFLYMELIMDHFEKEQLAISICRNCKDKTFIYKGAVKDWINQIGSFSIVYDENCCGATQNVLFCFAGQDTSILLTAEAFLDFFDQCEPE